MSKADVVGGLCIAVLGLLLIFVVIPVTTEMGTYYGLSPTFFPTVSATIMTVCAVGLAIQGWFRIRTSAEASPMPINRWNLLMFVTAAALALIGVIAIDLFGMIFVAPVLIAAFMVFLGERNLLRIALTSTLPVALIYFLAAQLLRTPLP